jgi:hypothetical protein
MTGQIVNVSDGRNTYQFAVHAIGQAYRAVAGIYAFVGLAPNGKWDMHYIGESSNLDNRIGSGLMLHHRIECAKRQGATHILSMAFTGSDDQRRQIEANLRAYYNPPCNRQ